MPTTRGTGRLVPTTTTRAAVVRLFRSSHMWSKEYVTLEEISKCYFLCRKSKRRKISALEYELDYEINNYKLWQELNNMTYEISPSNVFCTDKPLLREIFAAQFRDRIVHHLIINKINSEIEKILIQDSYSCRKGKGTLYGIYRVKDMMYEVGEDSYYWRGDILGFFMSIDIDILWKMLKPIIEKVITEDTDWWLWLIEKVVKNRPEKNCIKKGNLKLWDNLPDRKSLFKSNGKGCPIGNLTSQILANLYLTPFDLWIISRIGENGRYGRGADDFIVLCNSKEELLQLRKDAKIWLKENLGLTLHPNKTEILLVRKGTKFLGAFIKNGIVYPSTRSIYGARKVINRYNKHKDDTERFLRRINSYFGLMRHFASYNIRTDLGNLIKDKNLININNIKIKKL